MIEIRDLTLDMMSIPEEVIAAVEVEPPTEESLALARRLGVEAASVTLYGPFTPNQLSRWFREQGEIPAEAWHQFSEGANEGYQSSRKEFSAAQVAGYQFKHGVEVKA